MLFFCFKSTILLTEFLYFLTVLWAHLLNFHIFFSTYFAFFGCNNLCYVAVMRFDALFDPYFFAYYSKFQLFYIKKPINCVEKKTELLIRIGIYLAEESLLRRLSL